MFVIQLQVQLLFINTSKKFKLSNKIQILFHAWEVPYLYVIYNH